MPSAALPCDNAGMTIHQELAQASPSRDTALTIGVFDGVHLGHQQLLRRLKAIAKDRGLLAAALTFRNHPRVVLNPEVKVGYITSVEVREALLRAEGVDLVIPVEFTRELSLIKAREFAALLCDQLRMKAMVVGPDFALGNRREGDILTLNRLGSEMGFRVEPVQAGLIGTSPVKSSEIRGRINQGDVKLASDMLGRWYSLTGVVVEGDRRGRLMGFPTANLSVDADLVIPADGIYATWAILGWSAPPGSHLYRGAAYLRSEPANCGSIYPRLPGGPVWDSGDPGVCEPVKGGSSLPKRRSPYRSDERRC